MTQRLPGVTVAAKSGRLQWTTTADADGCYEIEGLAERFLSGDRASGWLRQRDQRRRGGCARERRAPRLWDARQCDL